MVWLEFEQRVNTGTGVKRVRKQLSKGANIYELSGNMPQYDHYIVQEIDGLHNKIEIGSKEVFVGETKMVTNVKLAIKMYEKEEEKKSLSERLVQLDYKLDQVEEKNDEVKEKADGK